jgi:methylmalonyl-CoA/ethylmalonyl-CoA epimerase
MFECIDHVGIAVAELDAAVATYGSSFGMTVVHREVLEEHGVEAALLDAGEGHVELLAPLGDDTPLARFLARHGPGVHHLAYRVGDIDATLAELRARAVELIDEEPRVGLRASRVAFVHPRAAGGVLTEIVEEARP